MAHFAQVENGRVVNVLVVSNEDAPTEQAGQTFLASLGLSGEFVQTSYTNSPIDGAPRGKYAAINDIWTGTIFMSPYENNENE